jgi:hypothetical protein
MTVRKALAIAGAIALGFTSFTTHASGADAAIDACVKSFVEANLKDRIVRVRKQSYVPSPLFPHTRDTYTVALAAHEARSGIWLRRRAASRARAAKSSCSTALIRRATRRWPILQ